MPTTTPLSPAKLAANRANALKSTGPRTADGKRRSARNALTHGLSSLTPTAPLLPAEDPALYAAFRTALLADLDPQSPLEQDLADRIVSLHWRLRRCPAVEAELAARYVEQRRLAHEARQERRYDCKPKDRLPFTPPPPAEFLATQFAGCDDRANPLARLHRYETSLDRTLRRCMSDYRTLQLARLATDDEEEIDGTDVDAPQQELPNEPTAADPTRGTGDSPVLPSPQSPNEPTPPSRCGGVSPPPLTFEQNEPNPDAPPATSAPFVPSVVPPSPVSQNEPTLDSPPSLTKLSPQLNPPPTKDG